MKRISLVFLFLLMGYTSVFAQKMSKEFKVTTATPYAVIDAGSKEYIALGNGTIIMAKMGKGIVNLQKIDVATMKEVARNTYKDLPKTAFFQDVIKVGAKVFYIYRVEVKKTKGFKVYSREINTTDATFKAPVELFASSRKVVKSAGSGNLAEIGQMRGFNFGNRGKRFIVYKSFDESKIMITYRCAPLTKKDAENYDEIGFFVFDNNMKKIWGKEVKMPYTEKEINNVGYAVSKSGEVKMLIAHRQKKKYEVLNINTTGQLTVKDLGLSTNQLVKKLQIREDKKGNFVCVGYYANGIEFKFFSYRLVFNANGLMYFVMDQNSNLIKNKNFDFTDDFIKQNLNKRLKKKADKREAKGKAGINDLFITDFVIKKDGSAMIVSEQQSLRNEFWGPQQKPVYHFANVVVIKINANGSLGWMKKLPKNQAGLKGGGQMSIAYLEGDKADYIAYVDNPKNIALKANGGVPVAHKDGMGGFLTTYKIDHATGTLEKHTLCDMNKIGKYKAYQFKVWRIVKASEKDFLMEIYIKGKKDTMVKFHML